MVDCVLASLDCASVCTTCADACLSEQEDLQRLVRCIRLNLDCAAICRTTAEVLSRADGGERLKDAVAEVAAAAGVPNRDQYAAALAAKSR